jgi:hypothetical protein
MNFELLPVEATVEAQQDKISLIVSCDYNSIASSQLVLLLTARATWRSLFVPNSFQANMRVSVQYFILYDLRSAYGHVTTTATEENEVEEAEERRRTPISVQKLATSKIEFNFNTHDTCLVRRPLAFHFEKSVKCIDYQLIQFLNLRIVLRQRKYHLKENPNNKLFPFM